MDLFKTYQPTQKEVVRTTHELDAQNQVLGRLATKVSTYLIGKHKVNYSAHMDSGDFVTVKNVKLFTENPQRILEKAVYNMLPANRLRDQRMRRLTFVK